MSSSLPDFAGRFLVQVGLGAEGRAAPLRPGALHSSLAQAAPAVGAARSKTLQRTRNRTRATPPGTRRLATPTRQSTRTPTPELPQIKPFRVAFRAAHHSLDLPEMR